MKTLKELYNFVCIENKGTIHISCGGSQGGLYWELYDTLEGSSIQVEEYEEELNGLAQDTWSVLGDYPEESTKWSISTDEVEIKIIGNYEELDDEEEEDEEDRERTVNTYKLSIPEFSKIYELL